MFKHFFPISCCFFLFISTVYSPLQGRNLITADPDLVGFNYEYSGAPSIRAGDFFTLFDVSFGGFFESRNEKRFTQAPLPNHNWRGFFFISYMFHLLEKDSHTLNLSPGFEHESAHPSQGFWENNTKAYEMIYDNQYRNIHLNSLFLKSSYTFKVSQKIEISAMLDYQLYGFSKNTPELHKDDLGFSNGFSGGLEIKYRLPRGFTWYLSVFDRIILKGWQERNDTVYIDAPGGPVAVPMHYPIINQVNTITIKTGIDYKINVINRRAGVYCRLLYGNIFGLVDSRENRLVIAGGIELHH